MTNDPINSFLLRLRTFHVHDVAVLFLCVAAQENTDPMSPRIAVSPHVSLDGLTEKEYQAAFHRLVAAREIEWFEDGKLRGYRVVRMNELQDFMTDFGRRRYHRLKARQSRESAK